MDVIILGSGTAIPLNDRGSPSIAVVVDGRHILFDMGPGTLRQLTRAGIDYERVPVPLPSGSHRRPHSFYLCLAKPDGLEKKTALHGDRASRHETVDRVPSGGLP